MNANTTENTTENISEITTETDRILKEVASIQRMEKGTLSVIRQTANGPACNFQRWEDGSNHSEYIPAHQVAQVEENIQAHARFQSLVADYAEHISARTRQQRLAPAAAPCQLADSKKKRLPPTSASPRKPKSKPS
jgi:hypothetical protein